VKRREIRERDDAAARDQAERRTEELLAKLKARESEARPPIAEDGATPEAEDASTVPTSKPSEDPS
jgi:hypothetical protein